MPRCKFIKRTDGQQCTRPADPKTGYCTQHYEIVQRERAEAKAKPTSRPVTSRSSASLPPDVYVKL